MAFTPDDKGMLQGYIDKARPFTDMFSVKGKVALVTGGSSGLGFDITLRLLQGGARVVIASNSHIEEEAALDLLHKEGYGDDDVVFCFTDVRNEEEVEALVSFTAEKFGSLDIFVNSAAIWNYAKIYDLPKEDLQLVFETNVYGAFFGVKYVSRYMKENDIHGKIVLI
jgi:NAD(P)-dependent dehydrogenase (short-subunit alcohol dehydrogenase family)